MLQNETFKDSRVEEQLAQLVLYRANVGSLQGGSLAREFKVDMVPTVVFLTGDGKEVHRFVGFVPPDGFLGELETAKKNAGL
ncbi:MAG TPA: thioredoxin fold domain-containing protein [Fimbriimonadales bacterium]|nr:thioredoxin fold domain-containing protein [Fimbriimonadales bacterium]